MFTNTNLPTHYQRIALFFIKRNIRYSKRDENGFVLVAALMFLVILTIMGMSASSSMQVEILISKNDRLAKQVFYGADGGLEIGIEMAVENVSCPKGFAWNRQVDGINSTVIGGIEVVDIDFAGQDPIAESEILDYPADDNDKRDITIPRRNDDGSNQQVHANISIFGASNIPSGNSSIISQAYDEGGASAASTAVICFDVYSQQFGLDNSESIHSQRWYEKVQTLGDCNYDNFKQ